MPETKGTTDARIIVPTDTAALLRIAAHTTEPRIARWFWEDSIRAHPELSFLALFANPGNLLVELRDESGFFLFADIRRGWYATLHACIWGRGGAKDRGLQRRILAGVMLMLGLHRVHAITAVTNRAARTGLKALGFTKAGIFRRSMRYNEQWVDAEWYELTRERAGLTQEDFDGSVSESG